MVRLYLYLCEQWRSVDGQKRKIVSLAAGKNIYGVDENNRLYVCSRPKKGEEVDFSWNQSWKTSELFEEDCCGKSLDGVAVTAVTCHVNGDRTT